MNGELLYIRHPGRMRIFWATVYLVIIILLIFGLYKLSSRIQTHSVPAGQVELTIPYSKYLVGEPVSFSIKNNFNSPLFFLNNCPNEPLEVYRQENGKWVRIHDLASVSDCSNEQRQVSVPANGIVNGSFAPWHHLFDQPGNYLIAAYVEYYDSLPYQEFEVITPPPIKVATPSPAAPTTSKSPTTTSNPKPAPATTTPSPTQSTTSNTPQTVPVYTTKQSQTVTTSRGTISVQYDSTTIYVISIAPSNRCTYEGGTSGPEVQVTFVCRTGQTQVTLTLQNGQLVQNIQQSNTDN